MIIQFTQFRKTILLFFSINCLHQILPFHQATFLMQQCLQNRMNLFLAGLMLQRSVKLIPEKFTIADIKNGLLQSTALTNNVKTIKERCLLMSAIICTIIFLSHLSTKINAYSTNLTTWTFKNKKNMLCAYLMHFHIIGLIYITFYLYKPGYGQHLSRRENMGDAYEKLTSSKKLMCVLSSHIKCNLHRLFPHFFSGNSDSVFTTFKPIVIKNKINLVKNMCIILSIYTLLLIRAEKQQASDYIILFLINPYICKIANNYYKNEDVTRSCYHL